MTKIRKIILAGAAVTAVAASSAFTAGITGFPVANKIGYGETAITGVGVTTSSVVYNYSPDNSHITSVDVIFIGDLDGDTGPVYTFVGKWSSAAPAVLDTASPAPGTGDGDSGFTALTFTPATLGGVATNLVAKFGVLVTTDTP
jgi:hypothetical protein